MSGDVGTHFPLPSRTFECPVAFPVTDRRVTVAPDPSLLTAGAHIPEADPAQAVASDPSVIDAERNPLYGDRVQHPPLRGSRREWEDHVSTYDERAAQTFAAEREARRQSRLSRWQEQR